MRRRVLPSVALLLSALGPACSGASSSSLLGPAPPPQEPQGDSAAPDTGSLPPPEEDSGAAPDTSAPPVDTGIPVVDSGTVEDVAPPDANPTGARVLCPMKGIPATCDPGQDCCVSTSGTGNQTDTCQTPGTHCNGAVVSCSSSSQCPNGEVCCGTETTNGGTPMYVQVSCATACVSQGGQTKVTFCDPQKPQCPNGLQCAQSSVLQGFYVCR